MADATLSAYRYPEGTSVGAYARSDWLNGVVNEGAAPPGAAADTATVTSGVLAFTGLTQDKEYVAYAEVVGRHIYLGFIAGADSSATGYVRQENLTDHAADTSSVHGFTDSTDIPDANLASPNNAAYRPVIAWQVVDLADAATAGTFVISPSFYGSTKQLTHPSILAPVYLDPADFAVAGLTTKYRVRASVLVNTVAPAANFQVGLYPVTAVGGSADIGHVTLGTVVSGSGAAFNAPNAGSLNPNNSADFTAPAAGFYALAFTLSAQIAANSYLSVGACLQVRNV